MYLQFLRCNTALKADQLFIQQDEEDQQLLGACKDKDCAFTWSRTRQGEPMEKYKTDGNP